LRFEIWNFTPLQSPLKMSNFGGRSPNHNSNSTYMLFLNHICKITFPKLILIILANSFQEYCQNKMRKNKSLVKIPLTFKRTKLLGIYCIWPKVWEILPKLEQCTKFRLKAAIKSSSTYTSASTEASIQASSKASSLSLF